MAWNKYQKYRAKLKPPEVRLNKDGHFYLTRTTLETYFEGVHNVLLYYNDETFEMAFLPVKEREPYSRRVRRIAPKHYEDPNYLGARVAAVPFVREHEIPTNKRFPIAKEGDMLVVNLKRGKQCRHNRRVALSQRYSKT